MTAGDLQQLLISTLARTAGGTPRQWRLVLGPVRVHDLATHPHCNWSVTPTGSSRENDAVERLLDRMRVAHPVVTAD